VIEPRPLRVALLPWGDVIEDYLDAVRLSFEDLRTKMTGGWLFGSAEARRRAGADPVIIICVAFPLDAVGRQLHELLLGASPPGAVANAPGGPSPL
jgi:hypothetical protein